jgi:hypothetical protein
MNVKRSPIIACLATIGLAASLSACGTGGATTSPSITPLPPAPTILPSTSPTPDPGQVAIDGFLAKMRDGPHLSAEMTGTIALDPQYTFPLYGRFEATSSASRLLLVQEGLGSASWERVQVVDDVWSRSDAEWGKIAKAPPLEDLRIALHGITTMRDDGPVDAAGAAGRRLSGSIDLRSDAFGAVVAGGTDQATVEAIVLEDGTPVSLAVTMDVFDLLLTVVPDVPGVIQAPPALAPHVSTDGGYGMLMPTTWSAEPSGDVGGEFIRTLTESFYVRTFCQPKAALTLETWSNDGIEFYRNEWSTDPTTVTSTSVGPSTDRLDAVVSDWQGTVDGDAMHILNVAAVGATRACDFQWFNAPGHEASDRAGVLQLLASLTVD